MGWKIYDEALEMTEQRFRYLPHVFRWRGQRHQVEALERSWTVSRRGWRRRVRRRFFQVRCAAGVFEIYHDLEVNTWHLRRARLGPVPAALRRTAPAWR